MNCLNSFGDGACEPYQAFGELKCVILVLHGLKQLAKAVINGYFLWSEIIYKVLIDFLVQFLNLW